jgi:hypothetical protein
VNTAGEQILRHLSEVEAQRARRAADAALARDVAAVKHFQHGRFEHTYADLGANPRYAAATAFFLEDLYGPTDFSRRDAQFARVVPALVRLFPDELVGTVAELSALHALSEQLDSAMGAVLEGRALNGACYGQLWRQVGQQDSRYRQISLMLAVGKALDRYTRNPLLRTSLRLMRKPAQAAGLGELQSFLEKGFDTFAAMRGAAEFLALIDRRERALAQALFAGDAAPDAPTSGQAP